jgi:GNAT superfamily N-acetyltransferase
MLIFENLKDNHIESAARLSLVEYFEERNAVPILPTGDYFDHFYNMISKMTDEKLGVAAIEDGAVVGFLTCYKPWNNHFGTTMGTFSPIHAHGAIKNNRKRIYSLLYQNAAEKWVGEGILSHAIALYAHDSEALNSFFWNGFGLRTVDAIRIVEPISYGEFPEYTFCELPIGEIAQVVPLENLLIEHLRSAPTFMPFFFSRDVTQVKEENERRKSRYFIAKDKNKVIAFIEIMQSGENFACNAPNMTNICGAYMMPEYRRTGIFTKLLSWLMDILASEGYTRCGVDFESFNPMASGFWLKHFTAYTHGVVRRIDERIYRKGNSKM